MKLRGKTAILAGALALVVVGILSGPAWAHHKPGHTKGGPKVARDHDGDADSDPGTSYTEDNDTNDGGTPNNQPDDGDNAHPSGKDRSVEHGNSGNQGNSESDPDDDGHGPDRSNGGPDKPNGSGGVDLADQDGNNGCGNDDDFEDDNEGWCGKPNETSGETPPGDVGGNDDESPDSDNDVEGEVLGSIDTKTEVDTELESPGDEVLGEVLLRPDSTVGAAGAVRDRSATGAGGEALPFTGANVAAYLAAALIFINGGLLLLRVRRS